MLNSPCSTPITLCMIVKNEAPVIGRCLSTLKPFINNWFIVDTGSTDGTQEEVLKSLQGIGGELRERPWVNFGHNRSEALQFARELCKGRGYILVIDADDELDVPEDFEWPSLHLDAYTLLHRMESTEFHRTQLFSASKPWKYEGVVHEYPKLESDSFSIGTLKGLKVKIGQDSNRRKEDSTKRYLGDAKLLEAAIVEDPEDMRSMFYLAQSYRDAGDHEKAYSWYLQRSEEDGWAEEQWYALYQAGVMAHKLGLLQEAADLLQQAFEKRPHRREPLVELAGLYRNQKNWAMAKLWSHYAVEVSSDISHESLFVDLSCHGGWRARDELAVATFYGGDLPRAAHIFEEVLADPALPLLERVRVSNNLKLAASESPGEPCKFKTEPPSEALKELHRKCTTEISTEEMSLSLEAATFLSGFIRREKLQSAINLGRGFSSPLLKTLIPDATIIDTDSAWLQWKDSSTKRHFELVVLDMGDREGRTQFLPAAWSLLEVSGWLFINDMHHWPYHAQVQKFLRLVDHRRLNVHLQTLDQYGRYAWLVQKNPTT